MNANIVIKGLAVVVVAVLFVVIMKGGKSDEAQAGAVASASELEGLSAIESGPAIVDNGLAVDPLADDYLKDEFGVDVDTPVETMRTLTKETRAVREDSVKLQKENERLKQEISKLLKMEGNLKGRIENRFQNAERDAEAKQRELEHTQDLTRGLVARLEKPLDQVVWTNPLEATVDPTDPSKISLPDFSLNPDELPAPAAGIARNATEKSKEERSIKAYTIPDNATLLGSISMTAMLGRIPVGGQVVDPYPFKIMVGPENLSSNGIKIPGLNGIKMSGIAKGDWTLSCVSGQIESMTFTFQDGTLVTFPEPGASGAEPIAWFSDKYGIPCVTGKRITNAPSYLAQRIGLTAASSYSKAKADAEFATQTNAFGGSTQALTGDPTVVARNDAISSGLDEVTDWLDERQSNSFDAIYVEPGTEIVVHVTEQIAIDYDPEGRKVNHYADLSRRSDYQLD